MRRSTTTTSTRSTRRGTGLSTSARGPAWCSTTGSVGYFTTMQVDNQRSNGQNTSSPFGACNGSSLPWDGNAPAQSGWPCLDQIGRGSGTAYPNEPSVPLYVWNNGTDAGCNTGGACSNNRTMSNDGDSHVQAGRDFINNGATPKPGYTPLAYPHPLRGGGSTTAPAAPTGLRIVSAGPGWLLVAGLVSAAFRRRNRRG